jgi:DNA gyrase subunit A
VISMAILHHVDATSDERVAYIKMRRAIAGETAPDEGVPDEETTFDAALSQERYAELSAREQIVLTLSENGYGKRSSAYEIRITGRGGKGIVAMVVNERNGHLVASFPVEQSDQIMLVTDGGQLIRCPVDGIRVAGRGTQGVTIFDTAEGEHVVSVERISEDGLDDRSSDDVLDEPNPTDGSTEA